LGEDEWLIPPCPPFFSEKLLYRAIAEADVRDGRVLVTVFGEPAEWPPRGLSCDRGAHTPGPSECIRRRRELGRTEEWVASAPVGDVWTAVAEYLDRQGRRKTLGFCVVHAPRPGNPAHSMMYAVKEDDMRTRADPLFRPSSNWGDKAEVQRAARQAMAKCLGSLTGPFGVDGQLA